MRNKRSIRTLFLLCLTASLLLVALIDARAQHSNNARGFKSESYKTDTIDHVNLFNGNLSLTIPIGQSYNAGGNLTYKLMLVYNSNVWDFRSSSFCDQQNQNCERLKAIPDPKTNAGMGWHLSLGRLYIKDTPESRDALGDDVRAHVYVSPDGAEHHFYTKLHQEDPLDNGYFYTQDSSYLRLHVLANGYEIEFPGGEIHHFNSLGRITQMRDRWGNFLNINYALTQWILTDTFGRTHTIFFTDQTQRKVSRVDLAAFNNTTATYDFIYQNESSGGTTTIPRHYQNTDPWTRLGETLNVAAPLLAEVTLPANAGSYRFTYYLGNESIGTENQPSGAIKSAVLPTLGEYEWTYQKYVFSGGPRQPPTEGNFGLVLNTSDGVKTKTVSANNQSGVYTYTQFSNIPVRDDVISSSTTTVRTPAQDETVYHFTATGTAWDYGLPYSPVAPKNDGLSLSEEVYKGLVSDGNKVRSVYLRYEADPIIIAGYNYGDLRDANTRLAARKTIYHDDGGTFTKVTYSNFDGLGHYRNEVTSGNFFPENSTTSRTTTMNYNSSRGRYDFDPDTGLPNTNGYQPFPVSDPWLLNTYNESTMGENGATSRRQYCFDTGPTGKGFKRSERILAGGSPGTTDVLVLYSPREGGATAGRSLGELVKEEYFGGDQGGAGSGTGCNSAPTQGTSNQYQIDYDYQFGSLSSKSYAGTQVPFKLVDNDIDLNTGLPRVSRDSTGIGITFTYDALGRSTLEKPDAGHLACTSRSYQPASGSVRRSVTEQRLTNTSGTCGVVRTQSKIFYDDLNRPARSESLFPGGTSVQETTYNLLGWKLTESERMTGIPNRFTTYSNFDAFGRPGTITPADGAAHAVTMTYRGDREVTRQSSAGVDFDTEAPTFTTESYDHYGRLRKLGEGGSDQASILNYALPANGGSVTASPSVNANYPASAVNDGDRTGFNWGRGGFGSGWNDNTQADYASDWVRIDFGSARTIKEVNVFTVRDVAGSTAPVTLTETFSTADNTGNGIVDFDVEYLSGNGWKPFQCGTETIPCGRVIGNNKVWKQLILTTPVSISAIRVAVHKASEYTNIPNNYSRMVEIEAMDTSNVNVARGILPTTSGEYSASFPAAAVTDGDRTGFNWGKGGFGSGWNDNTQGVFANDWVQVDFNTEKQINEVDVFTLRRNFQDNITPVQMTETFQDLTPTGQNVDNVGQGITYYNVQYWDNPASRWRTITCGAPTNPCGLVKNNNKVWKQLQFSPITTSKIRVAVRDAVVYTTIPNNYSRIVEIEAYRTSHHPGFADIDHLLLRREQQTEQR